MNQQRTDEPTTLIFLESEARRCGGIDYIRDQYPGLRIIVKPDKIPSSGEVRCWRKLNGGVEV